MLFYLHLCSLYALRSVEKRGFFEKSIVLLPTPPRRPCNSTRPIDTMNARKKILSIFRERIFIQTYI